MFDEMHLHLSFNILIGWTINSLDNEIQFKQESPAIADKPARKPAKIAPIRRAYSVVADNTGV